MQQVGTYHSESLFVHTNLSQMRLPRKTAPPPQPIQDHLGQQHDAWRTKLQATMTTMKNDMTQARTSWVDTQPSSPKTSHATLDVTWRI